MKADVNTQHPYIQHMNDIAEQDVVVIDNVKGFPAYGEVYIAPDMLILICHEGELWVKDMPDKTFKAHDISILLPDQIVASLRASADYRATLIGISRKFHDRLQHSYPYTRYAPRYRRRPATHLTDEQYKSLLDMVELVRSISQSKSVHRAEMLCNLLAIMLNMVGEYHVSNHPNISINLSPNELLFNRFYEAVIQHHRESHEMAYYARICCLSPKYFSEIIKRDTGISANKWISTYITVRAKSLLDSREDYSIQQISDFLGFSEPSSFSRFFKRETGMNPKDYRK